MCTYSVQSVTSRCPLRSRRLPQFVNPSEQDLQNEKMEALIERMTGLSEQGREKEAEQILEQIDELEKAMRPQDTESGGRV